MITVVSAFADRSSALNAANRLVASGFAPSSVRSHDHASAARNAAGLELDELATGGFASNLVDLFNHLLGSSAAEGDAASYADVVRREGTLVSVRVAAAADAARARDVLCAAGAKVVSTLPQAGLKG